MLLAAYGYGSVPFVAALARGRHVDLKEVGSGNVGAANLWRSSGARRAVPGWLLDASKGLLPVLVARRLGVPEPLAELAACVRRGRPVLADRTQF
jgi:glycerol-3-phosphate acyltransferase PlsY